MATKQTTRSNPLEQRLSDFGVLGLDHTEPETAELAGDIARVMQISPMTRLAAAAWRVGTRVALAAALIGAIAALTGCGGGSADDDVEAPRQPAAPAAAPRSALVGQPIAGLVEMSPVSMAEALNADVVISHRPGPPGTRAVAADQARADCTDAKTHRRPCVIVTTAADGDGAQIGKMLAADSLRIPLCDLTRSTTPQADIARCAAVAIASRRTL
ncbi:MAG: hypothetical protein RL654_127 [Pseudomonadota bacterium]